jgi:hypothetical protein
MNEPQTNVSAERGSEADLAADDELITAQQERIALLEAALAAATAEPEAGRYDLDEVFVAEGQGTCLQCSCVEWRQHPQQGGPACWLCGHDRGLHKRHRDGAQARP